MRTAVWRTIAGVVAVLNAGCEFRTPHRTQSRGSAAQGAKPIVTPGEYHRVHLRMSYLKVVTIIGAPGLQLTRNCTPGIRGSLRADPMETYGWTNHDGSTMTAIFQNDELVRAAQTGLR